MSTFYRLEETEGFDGGIESVASDPYHVLAPWKITDANGTSQEIDYDPLGVARRTSRYGTAMDGSSNIVDHGFTPLTLGAALPTFSEALTDPEGEL